MKIYDIINVIEKIAPPELAAPWDKSGLQVASFRQEAVHLAVMLDPIPATIGRALEMGADFILAHHPLSLEPRFPDTPGVYHSTLSLLFKADLPLYSAHTSLDANPCGPVRWLAKKLGLRQVNILEIAGRRELPAADESHDYGFGFIGELPEPLSYAAFGKKLAVHTQKQAWHTCGSRPDLVRRVACCPGSGGGMSALAKAAGADVFITGELRYHVALEAETHIIDLGHFQLEEIMMRELAALLARELSAVKTSFVEGRDPLSFYTP